MKTDTGLHIHGFEITNMMRVESVAYKMDRDTNGNLVVIGGKNGQGKTSTIDAIENAFRKGKPSERPVRDGQKKGSVDVILADDDDTPVYRVRKEIRASGTIDYTVIDLTTGEMIPDAVRWLENLTSKGFGLDPLTFARLGETKPGQREQLEILKRVVGLDFSELDLKAKTLRADREEWGREKRTIQGAIDVMPAFDPTLPAEEVSLADLAREHAEAVKTNNDNNAKRHHVKRIEGDIFALDLRIQELEAKLAEYRAERKEMEQQRIAAEAECLFLEDVDADAIAARMATVQETNARIRQNRERKKLATELDKVTRSWDNLTEELQEIEATKQTALATAAFPVPGLAFDDDGILYNGRPFSVASSAEQLRVSLAMGIAMNPRLKLILIRDGEKLDEDGLALVAEMAKSAKVDVLMERVGKDGATFTIHDGKLAEEPAAA